MISYLSETLRQAQPTATMQYQQAHLPACLSFKKISLASWNLVISYLSETLRQAQEFGRDVRRSFLATMQYLQASLPECLSFKKISYAGWKPSDIVS